MLTEDVAAQGAMASGSAANAPPGGAAPVPVESPYVQERWELAEYATASALGDLPQTLWRSSSATGASEDLIWGEGAALLSALPSEAASGPTSQAGSLGLGGAAHPAASGGSSYIADGLGSISSVLSGGTVSAAYSYTPWGEASGAGELPFIGYNSQEHAGGGTGLQYLRARFYDAASAAFQTADSYLGDPSDPSTLNRYAYCAGNPVAYSDPSGNVRFNKASERASWLKNNSAKGKQQKALTAIARSYRESPLGVGAAALSLSAAKLPLVGKVAASAVASARAGGSKARQTWRTELPAAVAYAERGVVTANASYHVGSLARPVPVVSYAQWQSQQVRERYCSRSMRFMGPQVPEPVKAVVQGLHDIFAVTGPTPIGVVTDPVDALLYFAQGEDLLGAVALVGTFPVGGDLLQGGVKLARHGDDIADAVGDAAKAASDVAKGAGASADSTSAVERAVRAANRVEDFDPLQKADSGKLRNELKAFGDVEPEFPHAAHHIIPGGHSRAEKARNILKKYEININSAANGAFLPTKKGVSSAAYHPSLHTYDYIDSITARLEAAANKKKDFSGSRREVLLELEKIKAELQLGTFGKGQPL